MTRRSLLVRRGRGKQGESGGLEARAEEVLVSEGVADGGGGLGGEVVAEENGRLIETSRRRFCGEPPDAAEPLADVVVRPTVVGEGAREAEGRVVFAKVRAARAVARRTLDVAAVRVHPQQPERAVAERGVGRQHDETARRGPRLARHDRLDDALGELELELDDVAVGGDVEASRKTWIQGDGAGLDEAAAQDRFVGVAGRPEV
mmetsp:Transcript_14294/g.43278  ORF Transcript_14294/g.43278 Transcript_14294/m.43278 type:complete len:204 (-) Transcript_14294:838-1449(-)